MIRLLTALVTVLATTSIYAQCNAPQTALPAPPRPVVFSEQSAVDVRVNQGAAVQGAAVQGGNVTVSAAEYAQLKALLAQAQGSATTMQAPGSNVTVYNHPAPDTKIHVTQGPSTVHVQGAASTLSIAELAQFRALLAEANYAASVRTHVVTYSQPVLLPLASRADTARVSVRVNSQASAAAAPACRPGILARLFSRNTTRVNVRTTSL